MVKLDKNLGPYIRKISLHFVDCWKRDQITIRAAALTYTTILSLVPAIAVCVFLFAQVARIGQIPPGVRDFLVGHLPPWLTPWVIKFTDFSAIPDLFQGFLLRNLASGTGETVLNHLTTFVANVNFKAIGIAGFGSVLLTSVLLLFSVEHSMNAIWRAPRNKTLFRRVVLYVLALVFAPLLLFISFTLSTVVASLFPKFLFPAEMGSNIVTAILITAGLKFFPNTNVRTRYALVAGIATTVAVECLKGFFAYYTKQTLIYSALYGGLSVFPFFLIWLYFNWIIVLAGTLLTYVLQNGPYLDRLGDHTQWDPNAVFHKERARLIFEIAHLLKGNGLLHEQLIAKIAMPEFAIANSLEWMRRHGWVRERRRGLRTFYMLTARADSLSDQAEWAEILGLPDEAIRAGVDPFAKIRAELEGSK